MMSWTAPESFDEFVTQRYPALIRFAHVLTGDPHTAADLVQEALIRAGLAWHRLRRQDDPEGYVRRTIVNLNLNRVRRFRREHLMSDIPDRMSDIPDRVTADIGSARDDAIWAALAALPKVQRTVLVLRFYEDLSQQQIAELLGCAIGTVKSNTARAMDRLRAVLSEPDVTDRGGTATDPRTEATGSQR